MAGLFDFLFGSGDKLKKVPTMTPEQQNALSSILSQLGMLQGQGGSYQGAQNYLSSLLSPEGDAYNRFEAPYLRQFNEQTVPRLAEQFAGIGGPFGGGLSSSGFAQALGGAGAGLSENLASLRGYLQNQAAGQSLGQFNQLAGLGLGAQPFAYHHQQGSTGFLPQFLGSALGSLTGGSFGGIGAGLGGLGRSLFGR